jgi:hypothetical protein
MNKFSSQQRKLMYLGGIVLLFIPIVALGLPKSEEQKGGKLARLRTEHYLDETTLGDVPPEGATMNLVLLGMRGVATNVLWLELIQQQKTKNWAEVKATTESIIKLQPHFLKVWQHQGWNLAYNVSAEWDLVADRYYWVKEGIKFYKRGISQNFMYPELDWYLGDTYAKKIGRADERVQFRRFFKKDPDERDYPSGFDPAVNPEGLDNYQVAKERYQKSIDIERRYGHQQHIMAAALYQSYPARADFDYAAGLQKDGIFGERTREAWASAYREWTQVYGKREFETPGGWITLEHPMDKLQARIVDNQQKLAAPRDKVERLLAETELKEIEWILRYQDMTNYRYWRTRGEAERESDTVEAHRQLYEAEDQFFRKGVEDPSELVLSGLAKFQAMFDRHPELTSDSDLLEEAVFGLLLWMEALNRNGKNVPEEFPLNALWTAAQDKIPEFRKDFLRKMNAPR